MVEYNWGLAAIQRQGWDVVVKRNRSGKCGNGNYEKGCGMVLQNTGGVEAMAEYGQGLP